MIEKSHSLALGGLVFLAGLFFLNFTSRVIFSPLLPFIEQDMELGHGQSASLFFFISAGYFLAILTSGFVSARLGHKLTIVFSVISSGVVLLCLGFCTTLFTLCLSLFCLGLATGLYLPSALVTISRGVAPAYLARGLAIHEIAPNLAFVASPLLCGLLLSFVSWQKVLALLGVVMIVIGTAYNLSGHGSGEKGKAPDLSSSWSLLRMGSFWGMCLLFALGICSTVGIYAMAPLFLVTDHGMDPHKANTLLAFSRVASIFIPLLGGWLGDRFGNQLVLGVVLLISGVLTALMAMVPNGIWLIAMVVAQPLFAVCFFPSAFAVLSKLGPPEYGNLAVSLCVPFAFLLGGGVMPTLIGMIADIASIGAGFILVGIAMTLGGGCSFVILSRPER